MNYLSGLMATGGILGLITFLAKPVLIFVVCKILIGIALKVVDGVFDNTHLDRSIKSFSKHAIKIALWAISMIMIAEAFGVDTASLVAVLGVASLALSLAVQGIFTNVFSGIAIILTKPFSVGDFVDVCGVSGTVKEIGLMRTTLNTPDNKLELIPNGDINASRITNYSAEDLRRVDLKFTASYDDETESVKKAILEVIEADDRVLNDVEGKEPFVRLSAYNAHDIEYTVRVWVKGEDYWAVYFDLNEGVRESYKRYGIQFTYPHVMVHSVKE